MRFKKLELLGFKTFAEHTEFIFEPGVTAIVGPNGTGKSNVADGIKWVLGEQSARELRGGRMEDLIFNGSDQRNPVHYAEVSLTLDNSDKKLPIEYSEVTISRRLFRSGESEYLLNGTQVRLKEISELLMGTGIGTSAYSLFEQGRIEQIISARPEDRRVVFEEAAGITKFKSQKREALRKLDETEANLLRISDVIAEVKRQIQTLERAVRRAKAYQEQFEKLKNLEITVARHEQRRITVRWQAQEAALKALRTQAADLEGKLASQEGGLCAAREAVAQADQGLSHARESLMGVTHRQETLRNRLEVTRERIQETEIRRTEVEQELATAQANVQRLEEQQAQLAQVIEQADAERLAKEQEVTRSLERLEECARIITEAQGIITEVQEQLLEETGLQVQLKNEWTKVHQEVTRLEAREGRLKMEAAKVATERAQALTQMEGLKAALTQATEDLETVTRERAALRENLDAAEADLTQAVQKVHQLEQEFARLNSQQDLLKGLMASHEGYSSGLKALLTALDQGGLSREGVNGVLAELIQVSPEESAAVDAALGPFAQSVVVESAAVAERCRQYLESAQAGRVLFLIRDRVPMEIPPTSERGGSDAGANGVPLIDRVGVTPHLEPLLRFLLADTWLVADRATNGISARFVTAKGELFTRVSSLLGSAPSEEGLVVGRKSRLQSLEVALVHLESRREEARGQLVSLEQRQQVLADSSEKLEALFQGKTQELHRAQAAYESAEAALTKLDQEEELLKMEVAQVDEELAAVRADFSRLESELADKDQRLNHLQATIEEQEQKIAGATQSREEISVGLATAKAELASFDQVVNSRRASLQILAQTLQASQMQVTAHREELGRFDEDLKQWGSACQEMESALKEMADGESKEREEVTKAQDLKSGAMDAAQAQERQWMTFSRQLEQIQSQLHAREMEQAQVAFQREQIASRLTQIYQVNLEEGGSEPLAVESEERLEAVRGEIADLSQKLERMGPVNLGSIEEERELQARYEFLVTEQTDLTKAKEDLHEAITKINRTTRAMFRETFQAIHQEFQKTFKQLFGGGEARLVLMDEEDLLESGIEIIARPPGKPLQAISLLSGGEKALTTIALLFAIFRVKPSPFCLLDEIDAPLDETNIGRFTDALKEFLKDSQFIIITHNKKTITMADVMYGITMAESGVSKIVSVKFKQESNGNGEFNGNGSPPPTPQPQTQLDREPATPSGS